jgi:hypothetical protein
MNTIALFRRYVRSGSLVLLACIALGACDGVVEPPAPEDEIEKPKDEDEES